VNGDRRSYLYYSDFFENSHAAQSLFAQNFAFPICAFRRRKVCFAWSGPARKQLRVDVFSYSLFTAAQFFRRLASISLLDFFAVCFIMVLCKLLFDWVCKKSEKQPIFAQKQPIFGLQEFRYPIKSGERKG
jgi:hypothetical protein